MIDVSDIPPYDIEFITDLRHRMQQLNPVATSAHCTDRFYIHPSLKSSSHIFLRVDRVQPPLRQPYTGPHKVLCRTDKTITVDINGRKTHPGPCQTGTFSPGNCVISTSSDQTLRKY
ncbi:hypothetical protein AVEN_44618-1 [Araneus ventricosus]|uniref:Uncharacterized protein n=1 Tax=Araneus ventricosus TaxID=182803 RepID=A0A4Y2LE17_ARAVE|nr:hypothetical protein AVEN_44618-1 [Araneus ventricosus]